MTPYYDADGITIYHGDCREVLPALSGIGQVLTSPPYNLSLGVPGGPSGGEWSALKNGYTSHTDDIPEHEYVDWQRDVLRLSWGTLTDDGAIYYNHKPLIREGIVRLPFELNPDLPLRQVITWDRCGGFNRRPEFYVPRYEWVLLFAKPTFKLTTMDVFDVWRIPPEVGSEHPAPFPLRLATRAISSTSAATVLDPFMGSGTTLRAAKDLGRKAIGIEIDERYCEIAVNRLAQGVLAL